MEELLQVQKEYASDCFFNSFKVVKVDDDGDIISNKSFILLETLESTPWEIHVTIDGWHGINLQTGTNSKFYPTFEGVARELSPQFAALWTRRLVERLNSLDEDSEEEMSG